MLPAEDNSTNFEPCFRRGNGIRMSVVALVQTRKSFEQFGKLWRRLLTRFVKNLTSMTQYSIDRFEILGSFAGRIGKLQVLRRSRKQFEFNTPIGGYRKSVLCWLIF